MTEIQTVAKFTDLPLADTIQADIVAAGYVMPTPIQAQCIPPALEGKDLIGLAQTGTGKTAAFALPIIQRMARRAELGALVLAPTRELAQQIEGVFVELGRSSGIRAACVVGGMKIQEDYRALQGWPNVLVATPGRLIDHIYSATVVLDEIEVLVVDEADRMHDMGFMPQLRTIIETLPAKRQTMMFTATMPPDVERIARRQMQNPVRIQIGTSAPAHGAQQQLFAVQDEAKTSLLLELLSDGQGRTLVFLRTKRGVDRLAKVVRGQGFAAIKLHGDMEQAERDRAMAGFRSGQYRILIATDIAARGIDVNDIEHVINYDFPQQADDYIHRVGRTARQQAHGLATSFVTRTDRRYLADLERLIGKKIPLISTDHGDASQPAEPTGQDLRRHEGPSRERGRGRSGGRGGRGGHSRGGAPSQGHTTAPALGAAPAHSDGKAPEVAAPGEQASAPGGDDKPKRHRRRGGRGRGKGKGPGDSAAPGPASAPAT